MSVSIGTLSVALLIGAGLLAIGLEAHRQNRPLFLAIRTGTRDIKSMLRHAFFVWSPMAVFIAVLLAAAYVISWGMTELTYRYTTLDEFCEVQGLDSPMYIACTAMGDQLTADKIRQLKPAEDLERQIFQRYSDSRAQVLLTPPGALRELAKNQKKLKHNFTAAAVLGLSPSSEDDRVLSQLVTQRRWVIESPIPTPTDLAEVLSYRQSVNTRNRILLDLNSRIKARRNAMYVAQYGHLNPEQKVLLQRKNRILLLLNRTDTTIDPAIYQSLLAAANESSNASEVYIRKGLVRMLAHSERNTWQILSSEIDTYAKATVVYEVLGMMPQCTVATQNTAVRIYSSDFEAKLRNDNYVESARFTTDNAGSFPCFVKHSARGESRTLKLASVGFRKSVLLSIDRIRDDAAFDAFKSLAALERNAALGAIDAKTAAQQAANVVPTAIDLGRQDCGLFHPVNCVMNALAGTAEAAYTSSRNELVKRYSDATDAKVDTAAMTIQQRVDDARVSVDAEVKQMHAAGYKAAEALFKFNDLLRALGWIALLLITLRSFLYVFALELFDRDGDLRISFDLENPAQGSYVSGSEISIDRNFPFPIINRGSLTNTLADIKFAPWKTSAPISRILHGRYFFFNWSVFSPPNQSEYAEQVKGMEASARSGYSMVEWRMQPGEEVIFNYRDFYGASVNVQLKTDFSLRLSTLLLGKVFFHYARCVGAEGRLLLEARIHNTPHEGISSIKPTRLVAWNRHAQFTASSHHQPWKTFINPFTIVRESRPGRANGLVIIAPESESPHFFGVGLRSLKRIFSKIF